MTSVVKANERASTAGQKFWPLKKFGLNNGRGIDQPIALPPPSSLAAEHESNISTTTTDAVATNTSSNCESNVTIEMEKKSKNKRLSSLLSSRRQGAIQNLQSHENTPEAIAAENTTKKYSSQTATINRKTGREIRSRTQQQQQQRYNTVHLTAKSAGSGTLTRANSVFNNKQKATKLNVRRSSDEKVTVKPNSRPQSPPTKRNELPTVLTEEKPVRKTIDESKIIEQQPKEDKLKKQESKSKKNVESKKDLTFEKKQIKHEEEEKQISLPSASSSSSSSSISSIHLHQDYHHKNDSPVSITEFDSNVITEKENQQKQNEYQIDDSDNEFDMEESRTNNNESELTKEYQTSPLPSPPSTPAAVPPPQQPAASIEYVTKEGVKLEEGEYFDEEFEEVMEGEEQHYQQQQYRQRQRRQNTSGVISEPVSPTLYTFDPQSGARPYDIDKLQPIQRIQRLRPAASFATLRQLANNPNNGQLKQLKRRPVSFIESTAANVTHASCADDYLTVRPLYSRRASHEDQSHHIRQESDTIQYRLSSPPLSSRRLVRSNTVQAIHNVIIKDGQGHRIVQCLEPRRKKIASFESQDSFFSDSTCWMSQNEYEQQLDDTSSSSDSGSQRRMKRRDSARSLNSLCHHANFETAKCEQLQNKLEKERATVKVLQKQKEACNKDISFLSQNIDTLTAENLEWKRKYEAEKLSKEKFQDELSLTMDNLNEATEQIRQLENKNRALKEEVDQKTIENKELEKRKSRTKLLKDGKSGDRLLAAQLQHSQNQVRLLKSTMEQFLRMGVFNDDHLNFVSPTSSIETVVSELRSGRSRHHRTAVPTSNKSGKTEEKPIQQQTSEKKPAESNPKQDPPSKPVNEKPLSEKKDDELTTAELDIRLRELLREKEILQAEYSKAPSSGGNAIVRRRREELESRLDDLDSQMCRIKLKIRNRII